MYILGVKTTEQSWNLTVKIDTELELINVGGSNLEKCVQYDLHGDGTNVGGENKRLKGTVSREFYIQGFYQSASFGFI